MSVWRSNRAPPGQVNWTSERQTSSSCGASSPENFVNVDIPHEHLTRVRTITNQFTCEKGAVVCALVCLGVLLFMGSHIWTRCGFQEVLHVRAQMSAPPGCTVRFQHSDLRWRILGRAQTVSFPLMGTSRTKSQANWIVFTTDNFIVLLLLFFFFNC